MVRANLPWSHEKLILTNFAGLMVFSFNTPSPLTIRRVHTVVTPVSGLFIANLALALDHLAALSLKVCHHHRANRTPSMDRIVKTSYGCPGKRSLYYGYCRDATW